MTGFGHAETVVAGLTVVIDVRSVNGRFLDINIRLPRELVALEPDLRAEVQRSQISRGRIDIMVSTSMVAAQQDINEAMLEAYLEVASKLNAKGIPGELTIGTLLQLPGIIGAPPFEYSSDEVKAAVRSAVARALEQVLAARQIEGAALKRDLDSRIDVLKELVQKIAARGAEAREYYHEKLRQRLQEALAGQAVDQSRLAQELVYYVERSDTSEEITRLLSHLERFAQFLRNDSGENVGKQLDFLCQEMSREMNTILSKSPLADIAQMGVQGKAEIEKMREQVQNVE